MVKGLDVFRLYRIVEPDKIIETPAVVATDLSNFIGRIANDPVDLKALGLGSTSMDSILGELKRIYGIL